MKKIIIYILLLSVILCLVGCGIPNDADSAVNKLEKKEYTVIIDDTNLPSMLIADINVNPKSVVYATKGTDCLYAFYFRSKDDTSTAKDYISNWAANIRDSSEVYQSDTCLYFGTEQAINDFSK